jgi:hypothetical protein
MKKSLLAMFAITTFCTTVDNAESLKPTATEPHSQHGIVRLFEVQTVPPVRVCQIPAECRVILDFGFSAQSINLTCQSYNGIPVNGSIHLSYDMSKQQMEDALHAAFGSDKVIRTAERNY